MISVRTIRRGCTAVLLPRSGLCHKKIGDRREPEKGKMRIW